MKTNIHFYRFSTTTTVVNNRLNLTEAIPLCDNTSVYISRQTQ